MAVVSAAVDAMATPIWQVGVFLSWPLAIDEVEVAAFLATKGMVA